MEDESLQVERISQRLQDDIAAQLGKVWFVVRHRLALTRQQIGCVRQRNMKIRLLWESLDES